MKGGVILTNRTQQPQGLIRVLLDRKTEYGARGDAASDLSAFDEPEAEDALVTVASDPTTDLYLAETCGASIAEIWCRKGKLDGDVLRRLGDQALDIVAATIRVRKPEWDSRVTEVLKDLGRDG